MSTRSKGSKGEALAVAFLQIHGYTILARNFYYQKAEIDIIAKKDDVLLVVEVKWRKSDVHGAPHEFVTPKKRKLMARAAEYYIQKFDWQGETRFDIISIVGSEQQHTIEHLKQAFYFF
jgi:putative endonuclease